jgi:hypothetical protein
MSVRVLQICNELKIRILNEFVKYALCPVTKIKLSVLQGGYFTKLCCAFPRSFCDPKLATQNIKCIYVCWKTCIGNTPLHENPLNSTNFKKLVAKRVQLQLQLQKCRPRSYIHIFCEYLKGCSRISNFRPPHGVCRYSPTIANHYTKLPVHESLLPSPP